MFLFGTFIFLTFNNIYSVAAFVFSVIGCLATSYYITRFFFEEVLWVKKTKK